MSETQGFGKRPHMGFGGKKHRYRQLAAFDDDFRTGTHACQHISEVAGGFSFRDVDDMVSHGAIIQSFLLSEHARRSRLQTHLRHRLFAGSIFEWQPSLRRAARLIFGLTPLPTATLLRTPEPHPSTCRTRNTAGSGSAPESGADETGKRAGIRARIGRLEHP